MRSYIAGLKAVVVIDDVTAKSYIQTILGKLLHTRNSFQPSKDMTDKPYIS